MSNKRKRDSDPASDAVSAKHDYRRQRQIAHAFDDSAQQLARAFKVAKNYERQKLLRRRKRVVSNNETRQEFNRIEDEIAALKTLDLPTAATQYLAKSLLRTNTVATSGAIPDALRSAWAASVAAAPDAAATLNVTARLCSSPAVKEAWPTAWAGITRELGVQAGAVGPGSKKKKRLRAKDYAEAEEEKAKTKQEVGREAAENPNGLLESGEDGSENSRVDGSDDDDDDDDDDEYGAFQHRLASSSSSDGNVSDEAEALDVEALERQLEQEGTRKSRPARHGAYDLSADLALSDDEKIEGDDDDASDRELGPQQRHVSAAPTKSAFLPSLTMGGYISGSGSDVGEDDVDVAPRKNRRGQRARQQIWEKKYGIRAKHLQKQDRDQGWDAKRGATDTRERGRKGRTALRQSKAPEDRQQERATGSNALAAQKPRCDDTGALHPSWEAAKRAKEKKNVPVAFQGKKISFD